MAELARVTAPAGWATLLVPVDTGRATTFEGASIVSAAARGEQAFGSSTTYGSTDATTSIVSATPDGRESETCRDVFDDEERRRWGLFDGEVLHLARRR